MARFKPHLIIKAEEEDAKKEKQEKLKKENQLTDAAKLMVREKGPMDYCKNILSACFYIFFVVLVFIGLVTLISPESRGILLSMLPGINV